MLLAVLPRNQQWVLAPISAEEQFPRSICRPSAALVGREERAVRRGSDHDGGWEGAGVPRNNDQVAVRRLAAAQHGEPAAVG
jgi:hypothetical protein